MSFMSKRTCAPLAVLACAAVPFMAPAAANAAIAGGLATTFTLAPNLVSASVTTVNASGTTVRYCFDKPINSAPNLANLRLNTYRNTQSGAPLSSTVSGNCADALYNTISDPTTYTTASVGGSAVNSLAGGIGNIADATALIGSAATTGNGTRGLTTAPDLVSSTTTGITVNYQFDEALAAAPTASQFYLVDANGRELLTAAGTAVATGTGATLSTDAKTVAVTFNLTNAQVASAVRAIYTPSTNVADTLAKSLATGDNTPESGTATQGTAGLTTQPDPIAAFANENNTVVVAFDQNVTVNTAAAARADGNANKYRVYFSDGTSVTPTGFAASSTGTNTVVLAANVVNRTEYVVGVAVLGDVPTAIAGGVATYAGAQPAVGSANTASPANTQGFAPAGTGQGAVATGFTTAADVVATTFNQINNTATVTFDQRFSTSTPALFQRWDNTGTNAAPATAVGFGNPGVPGRVSVLATFTSLSGARALQLLQGATTTALGSTAAATQNISQALSPSASSAG